MTKSTQSLTVELRDVARAFYLEVRGEAINATGVGVDSDLGGGGHKVYYLLALRFATSSTLPQPDPSSNSLAPKSMVAPTSEPSTKKEKQTPALVVKLESEEVEEAEKLKKKKKGKEKNVTT